MKKKRFNFRDDFEMLYLRHEYLERAGQLDQNLIKRYAGIVTTTAKIMFSRLTNFEKVGFAEDDVIAIANVYMLSYMALYSIQNNVQEMDNLLAKKGLKFLPESEIIRIDRNRLINFLRQKLHHCGTLCARKARNITVGSDRRGIFAETDKSIQVSKEMVLDDYKKYGYRKATMKEYKEALLKAKKNQQSELFDKKGFKIFKIERLNDGISEEDYRVLAESNKGMFYHSPDVTLQMMEDEAALDAFKRKFDAMDREEKRKVLTLFVENNQGDKSLKKELKLARQMLAGEDAVV
jgi:hypothetical protein